MERGEFEAGAEGTSVESDVGEKVARSNDDVTGVDCQSAWNGVSDACVRAALWKEEAAKMRQYVTTGDRNGTDPLIHVLIQLQELTGALATGGK